MDDTRMVACPHCHAVNRVPLARMGDGPACGACGQRLFRGSPVELGDDSFDRHVERGDLPVLVDFWAPWCGPCRAMAPAFASAAQALEPGFRLGRLNTDDHPGIATRYGIRSIPTLILFESGREIARRSGATDTRTLIEWARASAGRRRAA